MADIKTKPTDQAVEQFIDSVNHETRKADAWTILRMMHDITGDEPRMWGASIIGFGQYHYKYDSGHEGDMARIAFSPRKANQVLYVLDGFDGQQDMLDRLGKHKTGKVCLYINKLADVDEDVLKDIIRASWDHMNKLYP